MGCYVTHPLRYEALDFAGAGETSGFSDGLAPPSVRKTDRSPSNFVLFSHKLTSPMAPPSKSTGSNRMLPFDPTKVFLPILRGDQELVTGLHGKGADALKIDRHPFPELGGVLAGPTGTDQFQFPARPPFRVKEL